MNDERREQKPIANEVRMTDDAKFYRVIRMARNRLLQSFPDLGRDPLDKQRIIDALMKHNSVRGQFSRKNESEQWDLAGEFEATYEGGEERRVVIKRALYPADGT